jgi:hypothetical protein
MSQFTNWKAQVMGKALTTVQGIKDPFGVQCTVLFWHYCNFYWPKVSIRISGYTGDAKDIFRALSTKYWEKTVNDHNNPNQLPKPGDVMVFGATPAKGYTNRYKNPYGHAGICDGATPKGFWLIQQNAPHSGQAVNRTWYSWKYRPCIGWATPKVATPFQPVYYIVKAGDTLSKIAARYGTTWQKLFAKADNKKVIGSNPDKIKAGEKIDVTK